MSSQIRRTTVALIALIALMVIPASVWAQHAPPDLDDPAALPGLIAKPLIGIGAVIGKVDGRVKVKEVLPGSPAEQAGLYAGDIITEVDGVPVGDQSAAETANVIRGATGTVVTLTVLRGSEPPRTYQLTRTPIRLPDAPTNTSPK